MSEEGEGRFTRGRLEAFSDGVIGVVITVMVLDIKAPESDRLDDLIKVWPAFASYVVSFLFGVIYWINHHNIVSFVRRVTPAVMWANNLLLFCLTLFPFATAYMAATRLSPTATMVYGGVQLACAIAFGLLSAIIWRQHAGDEAFERHRRPIARKHVAANILYTLAIPVAYFSPVASIVIFGAIALIYTVPWLLAFRTG
jgi:uncharacterized membrane protein